MMHPSKRQRIEEEDRRSIKIEEQKSNVDQPSTSNGNSLDWRENTKNLKERHKYALKQGILTDVTFSVGPEKKIFQAHKIILALASPVFEVMFYGSLKETNETIIITDLMPCGFQALLDYIYTDAVNFPNETEAFSAWIAADKYCMSHMRDMCCKYLFQCLITNNNVWIILENAIFLDSPILVDRCLSYLKKNINDAILVPSFFETSSETIKQIVMIDSLGIREIDLLRSIVKWSKEKIKINNSEETLKELMQPFLQYIRFGVMAQKEFVQFIDLHKNIISDSDAIAIIKYMTNPSLYYLPEWCSRATYPRTYVHPKNRMGSSNFRTSTRQPLHASTSNQEARSISSYCSNLFTMRDDDPYYHNPLDPPQPNRRRSRENRDDDYFHNTSSDEDDFNEELIRKRRNLSPVNYSSDSSSSSSSVSSTTSSSTNSGLTPNFSD